MQNTLNYLALDLNTTLETLCAFAAEDNIGGRDTGWAEGALGSKEGKVLYTLVRATRPEVIVEVGSFQGCSTAHLAAACLKNKFGRIYAIDIDPHVTLPAELQPYVTVIKSDIFEWECPEPVDFLYEDGAHTAGFTGGVLLKFQPYLKPGAIVLSHDFSHCPEVHTDFRNVLGPNVYEIRVGHCGLGYWRDRSQGVKL